MKKTLSVPLRRPHQRVINRITSDEMVVQALTFLAEDPGRLSRFFNITGLTAHTLRDAAATPRFAASVFDYLGSDEALLRDFASRNGYDPADVDAVRMSLADHPGDED